MGVSAGAPTAVLLERDREIERLEQAVAAAAEAGTGAVIALEGEAGIGKSSLLAHTVMTARNSGMRVLDARGGELEREFAYGVVRQLFEAPLAMASAADRDRWLVGAARLAAPVVSATVAAPEPTPDRSGVLHGLYWLTANLSIERPLLLVIDDAHWADDASISFLSYLARRADELALLLVYASRVGEGASEALPAAAEPGLAIAALRPQALSLQATAQLITQLLGEAGDATFVSACHLATAGNPFLLGELVRALDADGVLPDSAGTKRVQHIAPRSIARATLARLRRLGPAAGELAFAVAVLGTSSKLRHAAALAQLEPDAAADAADALTIAAILRDVRPLQFIHPIVTGELARTGQIPHTPYYGTVDATPLFLMVAGQYYRWTLDLHTMAELRPAFDAALAWIDESGDRDGDGFVEYERRSPGGLVNQGWKDSHDAVVHADGTLAEGPIALVEVQGYVYAAKLQIAEVYAALGDARRAADLRAQAAALGIAFNEAFWDPEEEFFALALDGRKAQVRSVTSNPAHCLYCEIVDDDKAGLVAERLMAPDMFSGWGIRTLSSRSPAYNPMSYHNGSVWPHDNAIAAAGLKRYGFDAGVARIAGGLFDVASAERDFRLPELFCGFSRDESKSIVAYPVACIPQAWAAASPFLLLQALLGISAHAPGNRLDVDRPRLPDWLGSVEVRDIRVADSRVSVSFRTTGSGSTGFALLEEQGDVRVTMSA